MLQWIRRKLQGFGQPRRKTRGPGRFTVDERIGLPRRQYGSYQQYLDHQSAKIDRHREGITRSDRDYETIVRQRYGQWPDIAGRGILCLAARLGGEVRAFKSLGALAVGIDIAPGPDNPHVLHGDFHDLQFPDGSFDIVFTNALDHVFDLHAVLREAARVLKPAGRFIIELAVVEPGRYEVLDTSKVEPLLEAIREHFVIDRQEPLHNKTGYVDWRGQLIVARSTKPLAA